MFVIMECIKLVVSAVEQESDWIGDDMPKSGDQTTRTITRRRLMKCCAAVLAPAALPANAVAAIVSRASSMSNEFQQSSAGQNWAVP